MECLLIGPKISEELYELNTDLRRETLNGANEKFGAEVTVYSPWTSSYPIVEDPGLIALCKAPQRDGALVTDHSYLDTVRSFMSKDPNLNFDNHRTVNFRGIGESWLPDPEVTPEKASLFQAGRLRLLDGSSVLAELYSKFVDYVIPLPGDRNRGYSTLAARGAIFRTIPQNATPEDIALDLAHELGHHILHVWQSVDPILVSDPGEMVYSEIRRTLRPAIQTFHASVALAYMHYFTKQMHSDPACAEAGVRRGKGYSDTLSKSLGLSNKSLREKCDFTPLGCRFLDEMDAII